MLCPDCKGQMKPLFTGFFCPNDCDRPKAAAKVPSIDFSKIKKADGGGNARYIPGLWGLGGWGMPSGKLYTPATGQCPDPMCRAMGTQQYDSYRQNGARVTTARRHYKCNLCNKPFKEDLDVATHPLPGMAP